MAERSLRSEHDAERSLRSEHDAERQEISRRRLPDPAALLVGLLALGMSIAAFTGRLPVLPGFDPRWLLAIGAAVLGVLLLAGSRRRNT